MSSEAIRAEGKGLGDPDAPCRDDDDGPPSPGVDVHAVLGLPRPKRPSERSEEAEEIEESDSDEDVDSDDDTEEWQEGEYLVMEEDDDCERKELQTQMLSERASLSRDILVPIFTACISAYQQWISENEGSVTEEEMKKRREQLELYQKVLEIYGSDSEWEALTHAQRVNRNKEASETSLRAKEMGPPPDAVSLASLVSETKVAKEAFSTENIEKRIEDTMKNLRM